MLSNLNENYYLRNCFLKNNEVPTQSIIRQKMCKSLANVFFNSMSYKHKVLAGLEPKLEGGGKDRLVYPSDILAGRPRLRPMKKEFLEKMGYSGITLLGEKLEADHRQALNLKMLQILQENDNKWKKIVKEAENEQWNERLDIETKQTNKKLNVAFKQFESLYMTSFTELESLLQLSSVQRTFILKNNVKELMQQRYSILQEKQRNMVHARFHKKIDETKNKMKSKFVEYILQERKNIFNEIESIHIEKRKAQEFIRQQMECQNLACKMYIASVERHNNKKISQDIRNRHEIKLIKLKESNKMQDLTIQCAKNNVKEIEELNKLWKNKVGHIVDYFKEFVTYCLKNVPEQETFFNNIYIMLSEHLSETFIDHGRDDFFCESSDNPEREEISEHIKIQSEECSNVVKPFVIYGDFKAKVLDAKLCEKSLSKGFLPVITVNKRCIYAACDNFEVFSDKIKDFLEQTYDTDSCLCEEKSINHNNNMFSPIKENLEVRVESSLLKVIQSEIFNNLNGSQAQSCFCYALDSNSSISSSPARISSTHIVSLASEKSKKNQLLTSNTSIKPLACAFRSKQNVKDHLPPYMFGQKVYPSELLPHYEACTQSVLKTLTTRKLIRTYLTTTDTTERFKDVATQCIDVEYESMCLCLSEVTSEKLKFDVVIPSKLFDETAIKPRFELVGASITNQLSADSRIFASRRADSLRNLLIVHPSLSKLFTDKNLIEQKHVFE